MAEATDVFLLPLEEFAADEIEEQEDRPGTLDSSPFWPSATAPGIAAFCTLGPDLCAPDPSDPAYSDEDSDSSDDHATLAFDLFDHSSTSPIGATTDPFPESLQFPGFKVSECPDEVESDYRGLGLGFEGQEDGEVADREVVVSDWAADDVFIGRRSSPSESIDHFRSRRGGSEWLRIAGFDSDSDSDEQIVDADESQDRINDDFGLPQCWDCLQLEEQRRDFNIEMEWEEVDDRLEESDVPSIIVVGHEEISNGVRERNHDEAKQEEDVVQNIEWEVLLAVNNLGRNNLDPEDVESFFVDDHEDFVYSSDYEAYEVLFGQFADHDSSLKDSPPAAKSVVENLPSVMMTKEDVDENNDVCAVCKDGMLVGQMGKRLPCSHHYHQECILPWLGVRNTCPVCRFELPTDDPEYEKWKARRARGGGSGDDSQLRYEFEILPEA